MRLGSIHLFPVKSLRGIAAGTAPVERCGLAGDRRWLVVDASDRFMTQRDHPRMALIGVVPRPDGIVLAAPGEAACDVAEPGPDAACRSVTVWRDTIAARDAGDQASDTLSRALGVACRLVWLHDAEARRANPAYAPPGSVVSFADGYPLLLATRASLDDLNGRLVHPVAMARFRPNLVVDGAVPWTEDRWRRVRIGDVVFAVVKPCDRCVVTTIDPDTAMKPDGSEPLRTLARFRRDIRGGVMFGQNLVPETGGTIRVGDPVVVVDGGELNVRVVDLPERSGSAEPGAAGDPSGVDARRGMLTDVPRRV